jgi:predicted RNA-binding Zn-ribbon protein involved in translation (DUF1610 family)
MSHSPFRSERIERRRAWELVELAGSLTVRPPRSRVRRYLNLAVTIGLIAFFVAAMLYTVGMRSAVFVFAGFAVVVLAMTLVQQVRTFRVEGDPWLVLDKTLGAVRLPVMGVEIPASAVRAVIVRSIGSGFAHHDSLALAYALDAVATEVTFYEEGPDAVIMGGFGQPVQSETNYLAQRLASNLGVPVEKQIGHLPSSLCEGCGYDLRGTLAASRVACPECGQTVRAEVLRRFAPTPQ